MMNQLYSEIKNNSFPLDLREIQVLKYNVFYDQISDFLKDEAKHCVAYYGLEKSSNLKFYCCIAYVTNKSITVFVSEIESEELHEVGVGPIHAGVIEPGHFRFICNGEKVLRLEIQFGYQHRGI